jgi:hypothetical protein
MMSQENMRITDKLASAQGVRSEIPNQELAAAIVAGNDNKAVRELINGLSARSPAVQSDCIKTLYEIGEQKPSLIARYVQEFIRLLDSRNNRLQWGAMTALHAIAPEQSKELFDVLPRLAAVAEKGSVITRDNYVGILIALMDKGYTDEVFPLLNEQLISCPTNQLPMYAERAVPAIPERHKDVFIRTLTGRLDDIPQESKRKRVEKVLRKLNSR